MHAHTEIMDLCYTTTSLKCQLKQKLYISMTLHQSCSCKSMFRFTRATFCFVVSFTQFLLTRPRHKSEMSYNYWVALNRICFPFSKDWNFNWNIRIKEYPNVIDSIKIKIVLCLCNVWIMSMLNFMTNLTFIKVLSRIGQLVSCSHCIS